MSNNDARELVESGAAFLDERVPDWREKIDTGKLRINSLRDCVLGQLAGWYFTGLNELGITPAKAFDYGFVEADGATASELEQAWTDEIMGRTPKTEPESRQFVESTPSMARVPFNQQAHATVGHPRGAAFTQRAYPSC